ncbi:tyrosine-type recombinase/integrase [Cyclobacterium marinum]|uniref:Tyrosine recombinase xerC n=1 Tax=Cyclobacterium marinum (strain ATCC 25205 / DSM 745 / LMG 13164 / NCIMB 1802) TaxID=880070 RepID=G0J3Z7_CYCMS|nr:tyrosine-type recombinase/integrase [Cyclobacterium marinum]AEL26663.1 Tyrosine recombinase xerC [Cyclobacterium marinum DSM 745]MBI0400014.1 tyrosine-type recombinase/integrase [Cyclobacterium marinum]
MLFSFISYLEHEKRVSRHTSLAYKKDLDQFMEFINTAFGMANPEEAGHAEIRAWMVDLIEDGLEVATVNRKIATLRSFYKFLLRSEVISKDPTFKIRSLKKGRTLPAFIQEKEMLTLLEENNFAQDFEGQRDRMVMQTLYLTGIRLSELIGLKWSSVDLRQLQIKVLGKGKKFRIIPISGSLKSAILQYRKVFEDSFSIQNENDFFIVKSNREQVYPMMIYRIVKKYLNLFVRNTKSSPHLMRHTFATHLLNKGADLNAVKDLLGHASLAATQVYTHNSIEKLKAVYEQAHPKA